MMWAMVEKQSASWSIRVVGTLQRPEKSDCHHPSFLREPFWLKVTMSTDPLLSATMFVARLPVSTTAFFTVAILAQGTFFAIFFAIFFAMFFLCP